MLLAPTRDKVGVVGIMVVVGALGLVEGVAVVDVAVVSIGVVVTIVVVCVVVVVVVVTVVVEVVVVVVVVVGAWVGYAPQGFVSQFCQPRKVQLLISSLT